MYASIYRARLQRGLAALATALGLVLAAAPAGAQETEAKHVALLQAALKLAEALEGDRWEGIRNLLGGARGIYLVPSAARGGFIVGGKRGEGVLLARHGQEWSDPLFITLTTVGVGFQIGFQSEDVIAVALTRGAVDRIVEGVAKSGGEGGFALGKGIASGGSGSAGSGVEVLVFSLAKGLYAGSNIERMSMGPDRPLNAAAYGEDADLASVVGASGGRVAAASDLQALLRKLVREAQAP
jgi:lipid-binding SYLF domain-containing protein